MEKERIGDKSEKFKFTFTLPKRLTSPGDIKIANNTAGLKARHHILGRKYIQLLLSLALAVDDVDENDLNTVCKKDLFGQLLGFACWSGNDIGAIKGGRQPFTTDTFNLFKRWFFWSPYNLFVGPVGELRIFDPSSGVEQACPRGFPGTRWLALKAIPQYFETIGVPLKELVRLSDDGTVTWYLNGDKKTIKTALQQLVKAVCVTESPVVLTAYEFNEEEWVAVQPSPNVYKRIMENIAEQQSVDGLYQLIQNHQLQFITIKWEDFVQLEPQVRNSYKFILRPQ
jgi:hypothetical protein